MLSDHSPGRRQLTAGQHKLRKLGNSDKADPSALNVTLFRSTDGAARGWFIGPLSLTDGHATMPYLPQSDETNAAVAVIRAIKLGGSVGCSVCVIDPDDLWDKVWHA